MCGHKQNVPPIYTQYSSEGFSAYTQYEKTTFCYTQCENEDFKRILSMPIMILPPTLLAQSKKLWSRAGLLTKYIQLRAKTSKSMTSEMQSPIANLSFCEKIR